MSTLSDIEAEYYILAAAFNDENSFDDICSSFEISDFCDEKHQYIFKAILDVYHQELTLNTDSLCRMLGTNLHRAGDLNYLLKLESQSLSLDLEYLKESIKRCKHRRDIVNFAESLSKQAINEKDYDKFISCNSSQAYSLFDKISENKIMSIADALTNFKIYENIVAAQQARSEGKEIFQGHPTGLLDIDEKINGFSPGHLIVCGGRPGGGKSTLMLNLVHRMQKNKPLIFSLEMTTAELTAKLLSIESGVGYKDMQKGTVSADCMQKIYGASKALTERKIFIDEQTCIRPFEILGRARRYQAIHGIDIIFIDYLQLMKGDDKSYESNEVKVASISRELKKIAKTLNVPIFALAQMNRDIEKRKSESAKTIPRKSDLRESGSIEADADVIFLLQSESISQLEVFIVKNRFGEEGKATLFWDKDKSKIDNLVFEHNSIYQ